jgi:hypothetical protein
VQLARRLSSGVGDLRAHRFPFPAGVHKPSQAASGSPGTYTLTEGQTMR